jgi:3'-5' exoribonuclease 1
LFYYFETVYYKGTSSLYSVIKAAHLKKIKVNYIIYDVEATCWNGNHNRQQEIIEIGAIKINGYGELDSSFSSFVRPIIHPILSSFCTELTSISQIDVNRAAGFSEVIEEFMNWIEVDESNYLLCSWGKFDKEMMISDCILHNIDEDWVYDHIDIKQQYQEIKRLRQAKGLRKVVEQEGFEFTGEQHSAIDDAKNLAKIFLKYIDEWMF